MLGTIGYERSTLSDFVATLKSVGVSTLVDVRERAQSRRPGFSKNSLAAALNDADIEYVHLPELGDPKAGREASRAGNQELFLEIYNAVITTPKAQRALDEIEQLASEAKICLMCYERDQRDCHRTIVANHLERRLETKATHWGVIEGAANGRSHRRVLYSDQGTAASL